MEEIERNRLKNIKELYLKCSKKIPQLLLIYQNEEHVVSMLNDEEYKHAFPINVNKTEVDDFFYKLDNFIVINDKIKKIILLYEKKLLEFIMRLTLKIFAYIQKTSYGFY